MKTCWHKSAQHFLRFCCVFQELDFTFKAAVWVFSIKLGESFCSAVPLSQDTQPCVTPVHAECKKGSAGFLSPPISFSNAEINQSPAWSIGENIVVSKDGWGRWVVSPQTDWGWPTDKLCAWTLNKYLHGVTGVVTLGYKANLGRKSQP